MSLGMQENFNCEHACVNFIHDLFGRNVRKGGDDTRGSRSYRTRVYAVAKNIGKGCQIGEMVFDEMDGKWSIMYIGGVGLNM